ncbi:hypothetical protein [Mycolicibacterium sediminis]|uniref:DUF732 domain-containing protein n=1 Tax=Mycolicibacterium sediminis TaxID=1286180 RepID=A0A7I7QPL1_9MYCO|nr:hypothetical protein [Mycolicibacterium sediminis]BBY28328.1 hypothetical protein MSEDJ_24240 [Mycolicibacterium sediminis]
MNMRVCLVVTAALFAAGCTTTTSGEATAPTGVVAYSTSERPSPTRTTRTSPPSTTVASQPIPPEAFDEIRAQGVVGSDDQIGQVIDLACIMAEGSFNDSVQDVVDVLQQMGSELEDSQLDVLVRVALRYSCPESAAKLGA